MPTTHIDSTAVLAVSESLPADSPVFMLNLVRYREHADYGDQSDFSPCSGREAYYNRYAPAFAEVAEPGTFKIFYLGTVLASLAAPADEHWDDIVMVEYTNFRSFRAATESPEYLEIAEPHRKAALADWRLIATTKIALPD